MNGQTPLISRWRSSKYVPDPERDPDEDSETYNICCTHHRVKYGAPPSLPEDKYFEETVYENGHVMPPHMQDDYVSPSVSMLDMLESDSGITTLVDSILHHLVSDRLSALVSLTFLQTEKSDFVPSSASVKWPSLHFSTFLEECVCLAGSVASDATSMDKRGIGMWLVT